MTTVSVVVNLPNLPDQVQAQQWMEQYKDELAEMYLDAIGVAPIENALAGRRLIVLGFPPGEYAPAKDGPVRDHTETELTGDGSVPYCFAWSDDPAAERSPYSLWVMNFD